MSKNQNTVQYYSLKFNEWREGEVRNVRTNRKGIPEYEIHTTSSDPFLKVIYRTPETIKFK